MAKERKKKKRLWYWLLVRIPFWLAVCCMSLVLIFKWVPVRYTPLMLRRSIEYRADPSFHTQKVWVPLEAVSPDLIRAILLSEDARFAHHRGFDFVSMEKAWKKHRTEGKSFSGFSSISQQTAKNVFTWGYRTWFRKATETGWTLLIEWIWGKRRILEVYLNVAEMGKGIYGIEAAAQAYYSVTARDLDFDQGLFIASCLPNPIHLLPTEELSPSRKERIERLRKRKDHVTFPGVL